MTMSGNHHRFAAAALVLASAHAMSVAQAQPIVARWNAPVSGMWSDASRWSTGVAPNSTGLERPSPTVPVVYSAIITASGDPYTVEIDDQVTLQDLLVQTDSAALRVLADARLRVRGRADIYASPQDIGGFVNAGVVEVGGPGASMSLWDAVNDGQIIADHAPLSMFRGVNNGEVSVTNGSLTIRGVGGSGLFHATRSRVILAHDQQHPAYTPEYLARIVRDRSELVIAAGVDLQGETLISNETLGVVRLDGGNIRNGTLRAEGDGSAALPWLTGWGHFQNARVVANLDFQGPLSMDATTVFEGESVIARGIVTLGFQDIGFDLDLVGAGARLDLPNGGRLLEGSTITFRDSYFGSIYGEFLNEGTVAAERGSVVMYASPHLVPTGTPDEYTLRGGHWRAAEGGVLYMTQPISGRTVPPRVVENDARVTLSGVGSAIDPIAHLRRNIGSLTIENGASLALIGGPLVNEGELTLTSDAWLSTADDFRNATEGVLSIVLVSGPCAEPIVRVAGDASLGGTLALSIAFTPTEHAEYTLLRGASRTGEFDEVLIDASLAAHFGSVVYTDDGVVLTILPASGAGVPAPGGASALAALLGFASRRRKR